MISPALASSGLILDSYSLTSNIHNTINCNQDQDKGPKLNLWHDIHDKNQTDQDGTGSFSFSTDEKN